MSENGFVYEPPDEEMLIRPEDVVLEDGSVRIAPAAAARLKRRKAKSDARQDPAQGVELDDIDERYGFHKLLMWFLVEKGMHSADVYQRANITKQTFSGILKHTERLPERETILALAIGLKLNEDELDRLMYSAGYISSKAIPMDRIVHKFVEAENWDIFEINNRLYEAGLPLLGSKVREK